MYGMLIFVVLAVFIAGLMVGRTPEYLGKKIEAYDVQMAMLYVLIFPLSFWLLGGGGDDAESWALCVWRTMDRMGFREILYAYTSATGNNGSAFAG